MARASVHMVLTSAAAETTKSVAIERPNPTGGRRSRNVSHWRAKSGRAMSPALAGTGAHRAHAAGVGHGDGETCWADVLIAGRSYNGCMPSATSDRQLIN